MNVSRRKELFPEVTDAQWDDWKWQVKNRIETLDQLKKYVKLIRGGRGCQKTLSTLRMAILPYYISLINPDDSTIPFKQQFLLCRETHQSADLLDPLHEDEDSRLRSYAQYPDRVLLLITDMCSMYCRHCTRRRLPTEDAESPSERIDKAIEYIARTPQVRDVLFRR